MSDSDLYLKTIPVNAQPTEILASRFDSWRKIIRALNIYFREVATVQDELVRQNVRLGHSVNFPFFENGTSDAAVTRGAISAATVGGGGGGQDESLQAFHPDSSAGQENQMFLPFGSGSISDVPANVIQFHRSQAAAASRASKELTQNVIPRLEDLRRDLLVKIKEIKNLSSDFKNSVGKEQQNTARDYSAYLNAIDITTNNPSILTAKHDPYLLKPVLDRQLEKQINEENYLLEAFLNLQGSGQELEKVVSQEVQQALSVFGKLMGIQASNISDLLSNRILEGYVAQDPAAEWNAFIARDSNFVSSLLTPRKFSDIVYQHQNSLLATAVRTGYLERRSKYLKSYSRAWYVLTPSFLHEFKSNDRKHDPHPVMSLSLDDCQLSEDHKAASHSHKFILNAKQSGNSSNRGHNWVFRAESKEKLDEWFADLSRLTSISLPTDRAKLVRPASQREHTPARTASPAVAGAAGVPVIAGVAGHPETPVGIAAGAAGATADGAVVGAAVAGAAVGAAAGAAGAATGLTTVPGTLQAVDSREYNPHETVDENGDKYLMVVPPISSPVPSDTSGVTSNGEPFEDHERGPEEEEQQQQVHGHPDQEAADITEEERPPRGRFPSEVNLEPKAVDETTLHREAATFILPSDLRNNSETAVDDQESVFSYDLTHTAATLPQDKDFVPVESDVPVDIERQLTQTKHKEEMDEAVGIGVARQPDEADEPYENLMTRRRSSVASKQSRGPPSRRATLSYGTEELKPLSTGDQSEPAPMFFANGLPTTTSGAE
jgi:hypothetical protein